MSASRPSAFWLFFCARELQNVKINIEVVYTRKKNIKNY